MGGTFNSVIGRNTKIKEQLNNIFIRFFFIWINQSIYLSPLDCWALEQHAKDRHPVKLNPKEF